jgi:hypothetical protein
MLRACPRITDGPFLPSLPQHTSTTQWSPHMTLAPLTNASLMIQIHTVLALAAAGLTITLFSLRKGSHLHRVMGWT